MAISHFCQKKLTISYICYNWLYRFFGGFAWILEGFGRILEPVWTNTSHSSYLSRGDIVQKQVFIHLCCFQSLCFHCEPQYWSCLSYLQWLVVRNICNRVQNQHIQGIVSRGPFFINHGDTDKNQLIWLLLFFILILKHYITLKNT